MAGNIFELLRQLDLVKPGRNWERQKIKGLDPDNPSRRVDVTPVYHIDPLTGERETILWPGREILVKLRKTLEKNSHE